MKSSIHKSPLFSRPLLIDSFLATSMVFLICGVFHILVFNIGFMDPVHSALHHVDEEFENHTHAATRAPANLSITSSICLVNVGDADRGQIAAILNKIDQQDPKVVSVDIMFDKKNAPANDSLKIALTRLNDKNKLVIASWLTVEGAESEHAIHNKLQESDQPFSIGPAGYTNFVTDGPDDVVRHYLPKTRLKLENEADSPERLSFAAQTVLLADPKVWQEHEKRPSWLSNNVPERIIYQPDSQTFAQLDGLALLKNNRPDTLQLGGRIILIGAITSPDDPYGSEDIHLVPGRDEKLSGLEVHANIIAMLLGGTYMCKIPDWALWVLSFPLCWLMMMFFAWQFQHYHISFHLVFKSVQFLTAALIVGVAIVLFLFAKIDMATSPLLVPIALSVDVLYFYEALAKWLTKHKLFPKWIRYKTYFENGHEH